jgi:hypothetical protein
MEWLKQRNRLKRDPEAFFKATMARVFMLQNGTGYLNPLEEAGFTRNHLRL